jgi:restriction system protein
MDAILFSAKPSMVDVDDARTHLDSYSKLYWSVGFRIEKNRFSFPIFGFIHISGDQVRYRALVNEILPFSPEHYKNPRLKPGPWIHAWENNYDDIRSHPFKNVLVMTEIVPFSFDTRLIEKYGGGPVKLPPFGYTRVIPPNQPSESSQQSRISISEQNLEDFVVQDLTKIESGLCLVGRQLNTAAGRLDLLCQDALGNYVVVELKKTKGTDQVIGQILRYMGWVTEAYPQKNVRGIVIVGKKDDALRYAIKALANVEAKEFTLNIV